MTSAVVLCCTLTLAMLTACNKNNPDTPSTDFNKGIVIRLGAETVKPYLLFGASQAEIEAHVKEYYPDWTFVSKTEQAGGALFSLQYGKDSNAIIFIFKNVQPATFCASEYGFVNYDMPFADVKAELERNGFSYQGRLDFEFPGAADIYQMFLSKDQILEVQYAYWEKDNKWGLGFQAFDPSDLDYLDPEDK